MGSSLALELVVPCRRDPSSEIAEFAGQLKKSGVRLESLAVAPAEDRIRLEPGAPPPSLSLLAEVYRGARSALPNVTIGGGTFAFFTELNRNWPPIGLIDYITHMVCSVVHASDDRAMMENLESFRYITRTVRAFAGDTPYRVIASSIGLDVNPYGGATPNPDNIRSTMVRMDPRHRGLFGAAWTLTMIGEMARGGVHSVSPASLAGEFGLVHCKLPYAQPWFDQLTRPAVYPLYHVVAGMARAAGQPYIESILSDPTRISATAHRDADGGTSLWLANLRDAPQQILLPNLSGSVKFSVLDESTFEVAVMDPEFVESHATLRSEAREITIGAHAIARIQIGA